jgi:16S rRNA (guanine1207-N2)-methyltransferase
LAPVALAAAAAGALQLSPLVPGPEATPLESLEAETLGGLIMVAPPGVVERRYALAQALRALAAGAPFTVMALKDKGGLRLAKALAAFGCDFAETSKHHYRLCTGRRPAVVAGLAEAIAEGGVQRMGEDGLWTQPGVFSWDRIDPGSRLLAETLRPLSGRGADLGCGVGYLALKILAAPAVTRAILVDIDRRAIDCARANVVDPRAEFRWADVRAGLDDLTGLDFVVMNPPFHAAGAQDHGLGQAFIRRAASALRRGGVCWLVANRHLPYEAILAELFSAVTQVRDQGGYKVYEARR